MPNRPPYTPELAQALAAFPEAPLLNADSLPFWRSLAFGEKSIRAALGNDLVHTEHLVGGVDGNEIVLSMVRSATPEAAAPVVYMIHGGGMVAGDRFGGFNEYDMAGWVRRLGVVIVTPEYRLAPDSPAPSGVYDCYSGLAWVAAHANELGIDPTRIIVGGISGGAGLAAGAALMAREPGGPQLLAQLLICPQLDDRNDSVSAGQYVSADGVRAIWPRENNAFAWDAVLGADHATRADIPPHSAPGRAIDLSGLPQAFIDAGSAELFRDEAVAYASRLWASGVQAELHVWAGGFHGFEIVAPTARVSTAARETREGWLGRVLAP